MERIYSSIIQDHLARYRQMVFLTGPRQVGKTTLSKQCLQNYQFHYLNWDNVVDKALILAGMEEIIARSFGETAAAEPRAIIFDELHKYRQWKTLLKGYFDSYGDRLHFIITGSAKLNVFRRGGDSMMGRYFTYRIHPLSVAECLNKMDPALEIQAPGLLNDQSWENLLKFGGFPEPFLAGDSSFYQRWQNAKAEQLFQQDLRELTHVHDIARLELLAHLLTEQVGGVVTYSELAKKTRISEPTVRQWLDILKSVYYCFTIKPWSKNVTRSLLKEPKVYLCDWSMVQPQGARIENFVASHLIKAVHWWTDIGMGKYELFYLRDKEKREVDFVVIKNGHPWLMVEVKSSDNKHVSPHIKYFHQQLKIPYAYQLAYDMPYQELDCFNLKHPLIVPMRTFLSQLV
jgi:uncharacterized protein